MNHEEAVNMMATEQYLLDEMSPELRDAFEEHFFSCRECAEDVRIASTFIDHSKKVLAQPRPALAMPKATPPVEKKQRVLWAWPALASAALALIFAFVAYQVLVVRPRMERTIAELREPQLLSSTYLSHGTARGESLPLVTAKPNQPFVLFVDVPSNRNFQSYEADLRNSAGVELWSLPISADIVNNAKDAIALRVPPVQVASGTFELVIRGKSAGSPEGVTVSQYSFRFQAQ